MKPIHQRLQWLIAMDLNGFNVRTIYVDQCLLVGIFMLFKSITAPVNMTSLQAQKNDK